MELDSWTAEEYAKRFEELAREKGWSLSYLSQKAGLSKTSLCNARDNNHRPTTKSLLKVCDALDITMSEFHSKEKEKENDKTKIIDEIIRILLKLRDLVK